MPPMFDPVARARRRDRAARRGADPFLLERAFDECLERIAMFDRRFEDALLLGCPDPRWPKRLETVASNVTVADPGPAFASAAAGVMVCEERLEFQPHRFDLICANGTLDTVDDLPGALAALAAALRPDGLLIGAMSGGDTLPRLRAALRAADEAAGEYRPHVHPRIEPSQVAPLLERAGLCRIVVDVDRVRVSYASLDRLITDLRAMAATNVLNDRPRYISRAGLGAARAEFATDPVETFDILHFVSWKGRPSETRTAAR